MWIPLDSGSIKVNIDGAFPTANHTGAITCVCRDHTGTLIARFTSTVCVSSLSQSEIQALISTLTYLLERGQDDTHLIIKSDCIKLVDIFNNQCLLPWESRALVTDAEALSLCFPHLHIRHCRREANATADWAAKAHGRGTLSPNWASSSPQMLMDLLCIDALFVGCNSSSI